MLAAVAISGIALNMYSVANANSAANQENANDFEGWFNNGMMGQMQGQMHGRMRERPCFGMVEISEEFKNNMINIAKNDTDVQNLLNDGYNITGVRPIIKAIVEGDDTVVTKATEAIIILEKDTVGRAVVNVNVENAKVTKIVILTKTVIDKS
ncbi:hypothetical protein KEJ15_05300 [Candidatus Bathyarchaeota archaeon]|nr:hypothetical protein [Candidatus Bathyarchaeota archaeon]